ncbi:hypothetical protein QFC20_003581 [Naganishia adeliensis]|uniref:Uncharacterized protein n=1 Tax=Naganishia adeliensis TaxID=92952 RepID=A0ACC2WA91_9TREE|nr:hypothetical protein QFC20_003581 [Naganishia adeliensis]
MKPLLRLPRIPRTLPRIQSRQSSNGPGSLDALFQSPKLKAGANSLAFAREVRKRAGEYRAKQATGRHPLAPATDGPLKTIKGEGVEVKLFASRLVVSSDNAADLDISYTFLRDSCTCPACVQPSTQQKLLKAGQAYEELRLSGSVQVPSVRLSSHNGDQQLHIQWPSHESTYPLPWLRTLVDAQATPVEQTPRIYTPIEWSSRDALLSSPTLRIPYTSFLTSAAHQHALLSQLTGYGLVVLTCVPAEKTGDMECELRRAMGVLGELRNTFYGTTWDVKAVRDSRNIAYTDVDLGFHQDLCYFESPPRFQALHCLRNRVTGGSSYFTDAFSALRLLKQDQPDHYAALRDQDVAFVYDNDGHWYYRRHRTVEEAPTLGGEGEREVQFHAVNYSPPFQAPLPRGTTPEAQDALFAALAAFERLLARPEAQYEFTMQEGDMVVFDNRRVLHARRAFQNKPEEGEVPQWEATRWLKGCYMDGDVVWNKMRVMNRRVRKGEVEPLDEWKEVLKSRGLGRS